MAGRDVVGVAGLVGLLAIGEAEAQLALDHVAPAGKLGAVVGQPAEQIGEVGVGGVRLEADGVAAVEVLEPDVEAVERDLVREPCPWTRWASRLLRLVGIRPRLGPPRAPRIG